MIWLLAAAAILVVIFGGAFITYHFVFFSSPKHRVDPYAIPRGEQYQREREKMLALIRELDGIPFESVEITAYDGTKLFGRYYHVRDGAPLQIEFHGYRGSALRDFCGGNKLAREAGMNTLLIDERAHGKSSGRTITFGVKERRDCLSWAQYALERFGADVPVFLAGVSMGAATVLMASGFTLPENVIGIIADCPYSSPEAIIRRVCRDKVHIPPVAVMPFIRLGARLFGRFDIADASAVEAVRNATVPILLIHGEDDRFVPCDMSRELFAAASGRARLETFPGAGHGLSYMVDEARYAAVTAEFTRTCLGWFELRHSASGAR